MESRKDAACGKSSSLIETASFLTHLDFNEVLAFRSTFLKVEDLPTVDRGLIHRPCCLSSDCDRREADCVSHVSFAEEVFSVAQCRDLRKLSLEGASPRTASSR